MDLQTPLTDALRDADRDSGRSIPPSGAPLEETLESMVQRAEAAWPAVKVDRLEFVRHLAASFPASVPLAQALESTSAGDLYLAFACVRANPAALSAFDQHFLGRVHTFVAHIDATPAFADEVAQRLRERLMAGKDGPPGLVAYQGRGALGGWVRVAAIRVALNLKRGANRTATHERVAGTAISSAPPLTPELAYMYERYREPFADALKAALAKLSDRDRTLLRLYHGEGLALHALASLYQVHLSTVSRWLTCAREQIAEETVRLLRRRLDIGSTDAASIAALALREVQTSLFRHLESK